MEDPIVAPEVVVAPETTEVAPVAPVVPEAPITPTEPVTPSEGAWVPITEEIKFSDVKYGDIPVEVTIPVEVANFAGEKGIDVAAVSKELYSSEDFTLSEDTLSGLYEAFGQWQVDAYLSGIKAKNDAMSGAHTTQVATQTANEAAAWEETMVIMGGEDKWADLSAYASTLDPAEVAEFNAVMADGSIHMQQLMIKDLFSRYTEAGAPIAPTVLDLEEGGTGGDPSGGETALSSAQYLELLRTGKYKEDPVKYDKLRRAGMAKGL